jgi:hypothetical protein
MKNLIESKLVVELPVCIKKMPKKEVRGVGRIIWSNCDRSIVHISISVKLNVFIKLVETIGTANAAANKKSFTEN